VTGRLDGKVAIITGASTGLGPVMGAMFVREGAQVLLAARREELGARGSQRGGQGCHRAMRADVTSEDDVAAMVTRAVEAFGQVDIMCNNAAAPRHRQMGVGARARQFGMRQSLSTSPRRCSAPEKC